MAIIFWTSLLLLLHSYLFYPVILKIVSLFIRRPRKVNKETTPFVSILVAAYNEENNIESKIANFDSLDYPADKIDLLIGSDGSTDKTNEILKNIKRKNIHSFFYSERSGKAAVLNRLAKKARGEILVFSDCNTVYEPGAVRKLVRNFADPKIGGVCGKLILINPNKNVGGAGERLYWNYENMIKKLEGKVKTVIGANGAIYALYKKLYHNLPEDVVVMDDFLVPLYAIMEGYDVIFEEQAKATETTSPHLKGEFSRKIRIGAANFNALPEIKNLLNPAKGFVAFALWSHKIIRWFAPFLLAAALISNALLLHNTLYSFLFIAQVAFYGASLVGHFISPKGRYTRIFTYPLYFSAVNLALAIGFIKFITKTQKPAWSRIERS